MDKLYSGMMAESALAGAQLVTRHRLNPSCDQLAENTGPADAGATSSCIVRSCVFARFPASTPDLAFDVYTSSTVFTKV